MTGVQRAPITPRTNHCAVIAWQVAEVNRLIHREDNLDAIEVLRRVMGYLLNAWRLESKIRVTRFYNREASDGEKWPKPERAKRPS